MVGRGGRCTAPRICSTAVGLISNKKHTGPGQRIGENEGYYCKEGKERDNIPNNADEHSVTTRNSMADWLIQPQPLVAS